MPARHKQPDCAPVVPLGNESRPVVSTVRSSLPAPTQTYLRSQGLTDPATWAAFRLGQVDQALLVRAGAGTFQTRAVGLLIPTIDPRTPHQPIGLIRVTPAQNKHEFIGAIQGLGGPLDLDAHRRVVLADGPLLAMRLHQAGMQGVALVQDPAVLSPLASWLAKKDLLIASHKAYRLQAIQAALGDLGSRATLVPIHGRIEYSDQRSLDLLGIPRARLAPAPVPLVPITPAVIQDLVGIARQHLSSLDGQAALAAIGCDDPAFAMALGIGYLPSQIRGALSAEQRATWAGVRLGDALIVPACDASGAVVDALLQRCVVGGNHQPTLADIADGLVAPALLDQGPTHVVVTDTLRRAAAVWAGGEHRLAILRDRADAERNAARLWAAGVRTAEIQAWDDPTAITMALREVGIDAVIREARAERLIKARQAAAGAKRASQGLVKAALARTSAQAALARQAQVAARPVVMSQVRERSVIQRAEPELPVALDALSSPAELPVTAVGPLSPAQLAGVSTNASAGAVVQIPVPAELTPALMRDLHTYAVGRLGQDPAARRALADLGITSSDLVAVYRLGYLSQDFLHVAVPSALRALVGTALVAGSVIAPALDEQGIICDLCAVVVKAGGEPVQRDSVLAVSRGLLAPQVATAQSHIRVVSRLIDAARWWADGYRDVVCLRGAVEAERVVGLLVASGVTVVTEIVGAEASAIGAALQAGGLQVPLLADDDVVVQLDDVDEGAVPMEVLGDTVVDDPVSIPVVTADLSVPAAASAIHLRSLDVARRLLLAESGPRRYAVELAWSVSLALWVTASVGEIAARIQVDLPIEAQRQRFASAVAGRARIPAQQIADDLLALIPLVQQVQALPPERWSELAPSPHGKAAAAVPMVSAHPIIDASVGGATRRPVPAVFTAPDTRSPTVVTQLSAAERSDAIALAQHPDLLDHLVADLVTVAAAPIDPLSAKLMLLAAISRKLARPLWIHHRQELGAPAPLLEAIVAMTPPEDAIRVSTLSEHALLYAEPDALRHRLLVIDDLAGLPAKAATALRILGGRGALSVSHVHREPVRGQHCTTFQEVRGPVAVFAGGAAPAAAGTNYRAVASHALAARFLAVDPVDHATSERSAEDEEADLIEELRRAVDGEEADGDHGKVLLRSRQVQRVLSAHPVVIPFAERIRPPRRGQHLREDLDLLLGLTRSSALLHQHQRERQGDAVVANDADFQIASQIVAGRIAATTRELSTRGRQTLLALGRAGHQSTDMHRLSILLPSWSRHDLRMAIADLLAASCLVPGRATPGLLRSYALTPCAQAAISGQGLPVAFTLAPITPAATIAPPMPAAAVAAPILRLVTDTTVAAGTSASSAWSAQGVGEVVRVGDLDATTVTPIRDTG